MFCTNGRSFLAVFFHRCEGLFGICLLFNKKSSFLSSKMLNFNDLILRTYEEAVLFMLFDSRFMWSASVGYFLFR